jgi:hypothetical protein
MGLSSLCSDAIVAQRSGRSEGEWRHSRALPLKFKPQGLNFKGRAGKSNPGKGESLCKAGCVQSMTECGELLPLQEGSNGLVEAILTRWQDFVLKVREASGGF